MTYREGIWAIAPLTYQQTRDVRRMTTDRVLRKVAGIRLNEPDAWWELRTIVCGVTQTRRGGQPYQLYGKPKATIVAVRARATRDAA